MADEKKKPTVQFRAGALSVSVWQREHEGKTYYSATPQRAFTRDDGATWEYTDNFDRDAMPVIARLLDMAFAWIVAKG